MNHNSSRASICCSTNHTPFRLCGLDLKFWDCKVPAKVLQDLGDVMQIDLDTTENPRQQ